jgi:hypothetical protein
VRPPRASSAAWRVSCCAIALLAGPLLSSARAQMNQPIYPAYDGFLQNPDGSYTLAFAYFSHNADVVTIAPGPNNAFAQEPGDRQQPTVFKPGHWRFQCVMVVPAGFDGKMVWNLSYAGTTTGTSQRMLQSNWNLVEGAEDLKKIDYAKAPKGVCLNRAPIVRVLGAAAPSRGAPLALSATLGESNSLFGSVADEGLPRGGTLAATWKVISGPGTATFEDAKSPRTHVRFTAPGAYVLELSASDSELSTSARVVVNVAPPGR